MIRAGWICFCGVTEEYRHELKLKLNVLLMSTVVMANDLFLARFNQKSFAYFCHKKTHKKPCDILLRFHSLSPFLYEVLESWLDFTGELEPPEPLARLPQLKCRIKQLLTDLGKVQQMSTLCSMWYTHYSVCYELLTKPHVSSHTTTCLRRFIQHGSPVQ